MSLGERNTNTQNQKFSSPAVASDFAFANAEGELEKSLLNFSFWKGFLKVAIAPFKEVDASGKAVFDRENAIAIYLKPAKAFILANELREFKQAYMNGELNKNYGVSSGNALISFSSGVEFGCNTPCLIIRKINETGNIEASTAYVFRSNYHFAVRDYSEKTQEYDAESASYAFVELDMFGILLDEFVKAGTSAVAASYMTKSAWEKYCTNNNIEAIASKLGVDFASRNKGTKYSNTSYFNNNAKASASPKEYDEATIDDISGLAN